MTRSPEQRQILISLFCQILIEDKSPKMRAKAAKYLGRLRGEQAINALCQALQKDRNINVRLQAMESLILIVDPELVQPMSETPRYDLRGANIGNFADSVQGDQKAVQHIYAQQQNLAEAAQEIQDLLQQLQQSQPTATEEELVKQVIQNNPTLKSRLLNALRQGGTEALKVFFPFISIPLETIRGFLETES